MSEVSKEEIIEALKALDLENDTLWTEDGAPRVDVVSSLLGSSIKRTDIVEAAPHFNRNSPEFNGEKDAEEKGKKVQVEPTEEQQKIEVSLLDKLQETTDPLPEMELIKLLNSFSKEDLVAGVKFLEEHVIECEKRIQREQTRLIQHKRNLFHAKSKYKQVCPPLTPQQQIQHHIKSQQEQREKQAKSRNKILSEFQNKSPLDAAMARKNTRGTSRPSRTPVR